MNGEPELDIKILGPLEVWVGGAALDLRRDKERILLAVLALRVGQVAGLGQLAAALWEDAERHPPATLRVHISRLRHALSERDVAADRVIVTSGLGYSLQVRPRCVDMCRFEEGALAGRRALSAGAPEEAAETLRDALGEWRDRVLAGMDLPQAIQPDVLRLDELRLAAREDRVEADLACGRHRELAGELEQLVAETPLRERLWGQMMIARYRCGRQADALRAYSELRSLLRNELGISPGPALQALEHLILEQDPSLDAPAQIGAGVFQAVPALSPQGSAALGPEDAGADVDNGPSRVPFPPRLGRHLDVSFVGRAEQIDAIAGACDLTRDGRCRTVLVAGEAGMGKTRLVAEVARRAFEAGANVVFGQCDEDMGVPFQPFVEALECFVGSSPSAETLGRHGGELVRLVPGLERFVPGLATAIRADPDTERLRLFDAVVAWLAALSAEQPAVVVLDDLQFAEKPTLLMLRHLIRSTEAMRTLVIGTYRDTDVDSTHPLHPLLADLRRETNVSRITLAGLDRAAVGEMVARTGGQLEGSSVLAERLCALTNGNPFYLHEVIRGLVDDGGAGIDEGEFEIPDSVREVVRRRVERLSEPTQRVLALTAVVGQVLDFDLVRELSGLREEAVLDALDEATAAGLLHESASGSYEFAHGIVRGTLYDELGGERRSRRHLQVAEALLARGAKDPIVLAYHFAQARPVDPRVVEYMAEAAEVALSQLAFDQAADLFSQAISVAESAAIGPARRCALAVRLGRAERLAGIPGSRETLLAAARDAQRFGHPALVAEAAFEGFGGSPNAIGVRDTERIAVIEAALASMATGDSPERARLMSALALETVWDDPDSHRLELADQALAMARRLGAPKCLLEVWLSAHIACSVPDRTPSLVAEVPELLDLAGRVGDAQQLAIACAWGSIHYLESGAYVESGQLVERMGTLAAELPYPLYRWWDAIYRCCRLTMLGSGDEIEQAALDAFQIGQDAGQPDLNSFFAAQLAVARWAQGRLGEMAELLSATASDLLAPSAFRAALAQSLAMSGRSEEARSVLAELTADIEKSIPWDLAWLVTHSLLAEAISLVGIPEQAACEYEVLAPYEERIPSIGIISRPAVCLWLGELAVRAGWDDRAELHFARAHERHEDIGAPVWLAHTQLAWGRFLIERGEIERGRDLIGRAREGAERTGAADVLQATKQLLM